MARTRQTRKRSNGPLRRTFKKRRTTRRRRSSSAKTSSFMGSTTSIIRRRGRKMRPSSYRGALLRSSLFAAKYVYAAVGASAANTPADLVSYNWQRFLCMQDVATSSSWSSPNGTVVPATVEAGFVVRGGYSKYTISSEAAEEIEFIVYLVWCKSNGTPPSTGTLIKARDPVVNTIDEQDATLRVVKSWSGTLGINASMSFYTKIKPKLYDQSLYNDGTDAMYWYSGIGNTVTNSAVGVTSIVTTNVSVCVRT